jgi:hypothetical protein
MPTEGVTERGGKLLGRDGTSLNPSGLLELRIRVDVGGGTDRLEALADESGDDRGGGTVRGGELGLESPETAGVPIAGESLRVGGMVGCVTAGGMLLE